jgi:hypothetical protein
MQHFLVILLCLHLGIGLLLLNVGPLSALIHESRQDPLFSRLILAVFLLLLWPCLWPTAVYRPQFGLGALTFEIHSRLDQVDSDRWSASSDVIANAGWATGTGTADPAR